MSTRWVFNEEVDEEAVAQLSTEINVNRTIAKILIQREITTYDEAKNYFRPSLDQLHDPFLMGDMDKALGRIQKAITNNEKILIHDAAVVLSTLPITSVGSVTVQESVAVQSFKSVTVTLYTPAAAYILLGLVEVELWPSPKFQL